MSGTVTSLKPSARERERETADNLDSSDCDDEIASKFVAAQLNMQAASARQQAKAGVKSADKTKLANESDPMLEYCDKYKPKSDKELSRVTSPLE